MIDRLLLVFIAMHAPVLAAEGSYAWQGYTWKRAGLYDCIAVSDDALCFAYHQKWDWKRDQWVDFSYGINAARGELVTELTLTNRDRKDRDDVCVTVLFLDADGRDLFAFHQNLSSGPSSVRTEAFRYAVAPQVWQMTTQLVMGSKQCRKGPHEDDGVFAAARVRTGQR